MPCTSKKFEAQRPEMEVNGLRAVDISLTTRELARMIHDARIDFVRLPDEECFDELVAQSTGAAPIFGATGGVMEAALRTAADVLEKRSVENVEYHEVRGLAGIKEATFTLGGKELKVAVASSTGAAKELIQRIKAGDASYAFVEVMACRAAASTAAVSRLFRRTSAWISIRAKSARRGCMPRTSPRSSANPTRIRILKSSTRNSWASRTAIWRTGCCIPSIPTAAEANRF